jgi:hypothetical protein
MGGGWRGSVLKNAATRRDTLETCEHIGGPHRGKMLQKKPSEPSEEPKCAAFLQVVIEDSDSVDGWSVGPAGKNGKMFRTMCDGVMVVDTTTRVPCRVSTGRPLIFVPGSQLVLRAPRPSVPALRPFVEQQGHHYTRGSAGGVGHRW